MAGTWQSVWQRLGLVGAALASGCAPQTTMSCTSTSTVTTNGSTWVSVVCVERATGDVDASRAFCVASGGARDAGVAVTESFRDGPCSRSMAVGGCRLGDGTTTWFYVGYEADSAEAQCTIDHGAFVAP